LIDIPLAFVIVVIAGAAAQSIVGIGFGVIVGPTLLLALGASGAIQVSIALSFLVAITIAPKVYKQVDNRLLGPLIMGALPGTLIGGAISVALDHAALKILGALVVFAMAITATGIFHRVARPSSSPKKQRISVGAISGVLNTTLAMPGPAIAAYAAWVGLNKETTRATTLATFVLAYPIAFALQVITKGLSPALETVALPLIIPTLVGTVLGIVLSRYVPQKMFNNLITIFLFGSGISLLLSL